VNAEIYSEWLRRQNLKVVCTESSWWHSQVRGVFQAFPYHQLIQPSDAELNELTRKHGAIALRYSAPIESEKGSPSYHVVYTGSEYGFNSLGGYARKNVRRGLKHSIVQPISLDRYIREGWALRVDTLARQKRALREARDDWERIYAAIADLSGFEIWGAEIGDRLAATVVIFRLDNWYYMVYQQCHSDFLRAHAPNALSFTVTEELMRRPRVEGIFYGMQSLDAPPSVDEFKFRMGYEARPVRQCVHFHSWMEPLVNRWTHKLLRNVSKLAPGHYWLAKAEGMLRVFLEGEGALQPTKDYRQEILSAAASNTETA
jgi:hypothetical protein